MGQDPAAAFRRWRHLRSDHRGGQLSGGAAAAGRPGDAPLTRTQRARILPGFGLTLGVTLAILGIVVLLPLAALLAEAATTLPMRAAAEVSSPRTLAAMRTSFGIAALAAVVDAVMGLWIAVVLTRYSFPGHRLLDAAVDLPFALPTAVAGVALASLYADGGWIGRLLPFPVAYTPAGIFVALLFVGLPFCVRSVQPLLADNDRDAEEAALTLGAGAWTIMRRIVLPPVMPALLTGLALAFARAVGEYGSVIFIAGNRPGLSEILPLLIVIKLDQFDYPGAATLGAAMLLLSLLLLIGINSLQGWSRRRWGEERAS